MNGISKVAVTVAAAILFTTHAGAAIVGSQAPDFILQDQSGAEVSLSDFAGTGVILDFCAMWCGPCQDFYQYSYAQMPGNTLILPVLMENVSGGVSNQTNAAVWADAFGLDSVAHLSGDEGAKTALLVDYFTDLDSVAYPTFVFIDADLTVVGNIVGVRDPGDVEWAGYVASIQATQAVPVPAAVWLLGSGLIAMLGVARESARRRL
jgi:thiol-disulfide isomerase/thioredoxin